MLIARDAYLLQPGSKKVEPGWSHREFHRSSSAFDKGWPQKYQVASLQPLVAAVLVRVYIERSAMETEIRNVTLMQA